MYELVQVGAGSYYVECPAKIGIYVNGQDEACLIDSGNDKEAGRRVNKILSERGWKLKIIINTHSNADHMGGNEFLCSRTGAPAYAPPMEVPFIRYPQLETSFLYGGYPCVALRNKFLMGPPHHAKKFPAELPDGLSTFPLKGHFFDMVGVRTADDVYFLADCMVGEAILEKYHLSFIYDVGEYIKTLEWAKTLTGRCFVPSHGKAAADIGPLADLNLKKVLEIRSLILDICHNPSGPEDILTALFDNFGLVMDFNQYVLAGSTVRSYLSYLYDTGKIEPSFAGNRLTWQAV